ncbi:MAG: hypothetical protein JWQ08_795 [Deinococcus sp.]|nr:hypothetical protein [Deinococcus sp.]
MKVIGSELGFLLLSWIIPIQGNRPGPTLAVLGCAERGVARGEYRCRCVVLGRTGPDGRARYGGPPSVLTERCGPQPRHGLWSGVRGSGVVDPTPSGGTGGFGRAPDHTWRVDRAGGVSVWSRCRGVVARGRQLNGLQPHLLLATVLIHALPNIPWVLDCFTGSPSD